MGRPLRIVSSCGEPWDAMTPRTGGRHCGKCDRVVVDVRGLGRAEALAKLDAVRRERGDVCGRATVDAATREVIFAREPSAPRGFPFRGVLLAATLATGCEHAVHAAPARPTAMLAPLSAPKRGGGPADEEPLPPPPPAPGRLQDAADGGVPDAGAPDGGRRHHRRRPPPVQVDDVGYMADDF